jgi:hypothetical protein
MATIKAYPGRNPFCLQVTLCRNPAQTDQSLSCPFQPRQHLVHRHRRHAYAFRIVLFDFRLLPFSAWPLQPADDRLGKLLGRCTAAQVAGPHLIFIQRLMDGFAQLVSKFAPANVIKHHRGR